MEVGERNKQRGLCRSMKQIKQIFISCFFIPDNMNAGEKILTYTIFRTLPSVQLLIVQLAESSPKVV